MCMQDLAISRNVTWRQTDIQIDPAGTAAFLPPSPNRIAVMGNDLALAAPVVWRLGRINQTPELPFYHDSFNARNNPRAIVTIFDFPGIFNDRLWTTAIPGFAVVWEAVLDQGIGLAVEALVEQFRELGRK